MKKLQVLLIALLALCASRAHAATCPVSAGSSQATIQSTMTGCTVGDTLTLAAGSYVINSSMTYKCGVNLAGPTQSPAYQTRGNSVVLVYPTTATLSATGRTFPIWTLSNCTTATTVSGVKYLNTSAFFLTGPINHFTFTQNACYNLPGGEGNNGSCIYAALGHNTNPMGPDVNYSWNDVGDANSCLTPTNVMQQAQADQGGLCNGFMEKGQINGITIIDNSLFHLENGINKIVCDGSGSSCEPSGGQSPTQNVVVEHNNADSIHRAWLEQQPQPTSGWVEQYNSHQHIFNPNKLSIGISLPCCDTGATSPGQVMINNVITDDVPPLAGDYIAFGCECWGNGMQANNNLVQGPFKNGITWGFGLAPWQINNNIIQIPSGGGYITNEEGQTNTPSIIGNVTGTTVAQQQSAPPSISPASGSVSFPLTVTITDTGITSSGKGPQGNTSIWYTTDGTAPAVNSGTTKLCNPSGATSCTFTLSSAATVRAIGMWGTGANTISYVGPYGFGPSAIIATSYTSGTPAVATPTFSPASENFSSSLSVSIADATSGSTIYYTTDGSTPSTGSSVYSGPITVTAASTLVQAIATKSGLTQSLVGSATYVNTAYVATPTFLPASEGFTGSLSITLADATSGASIYYTTDGTTPSTSGGGAPVGNTYYISPSGSDSNAGTSSALPWLTPNHALNCSDVILAASGTYSASNFQSGKWGTVTCAGGDNVAWLQCVTFDTCKINAVGSSPTSGSDGMWVDKSYWGVRGWEITTSVYKFGACFHAGPSGGSTVHHIVFANNVANGCMGGGFNAYDASTSASVDYIAYVGNVAWNAAQGSGACYSGLNIYQPIASDANSGTHMYIAGNFSYNNVDASPCSGGLTTDGEGINLDTFDFSQGGGTAYVQQAVVENNISVSNGSSGILMENNKTGPGSAPTYFLQNTTYGNLKATNLSFCVGHGEITLQAALTVTATGNLSATNSATGCSSAAIYGFAVADSDSSDSVDANWIVGKSGNNTFISSSGSFAYGASNVIGTDPAFVSTTIPGAPSCSGKANVPACMAAMVANFTPTAGGASGFGYQPPSMATVTDPYFPTWLCNTNLPAGLVSSPCASSDLYTGPFTITATTTVKAIGVKSGFTTSPTAISTYTVSTAPTAGTPTFSPGSETFSGTATVSIASTTSGATIYYTTDGTTPTPASSVYSAPLSITTTTVVNAIAAKSGFITSPVGTATYTTSATVAATPTFSPDSENYFSSVNVAIASATSGATIYYTTDGTTPTTGSTLYTGPITIAASLGDTTTVQALAVKSGLTDSSIGSASYMSSQQIAATPTFSPDSETYDTSVTVTLADSTPASTIYYTLDGSTPTTSSTVYTAPIMIMGGVGITTNIKAIAAASGFTNSPVGHATYLNVPMAAATPTFSPTSEDFSSTISVTISDSTSGATIYYTRDGTTPTVASNVYSGPITVATTTVVKAIAIAGGFSDSAIGQATYTYTGPPPPPPPAIIPGPQMFSSTLTVTITGPSGSTIYYTLDGSTPTTSSTRYTGSFLVGSGLATNWPVAAIAVVGGVSSLPVNVTYTKGSCPGCWWH